MSEYKRMQKLAGLIKENKDYSHDYDGDDNYDTSDDIEELAKKIGNLHVIEPGHEDQKYKGEEFAYYIDGNTYVYIMGDAVILEYVDDEGEEIEKYRCNDIEEMAEYIIKHFESPQYQSINEDSNPVLTQFQNIEGMGSEIWDFLDNLDNTELEGLYNDLYPEDYQENVKQYSIDKLKQEIYNYWENPAMFESTMITKSTDSSKASEIANREKTDVQSVQQAIQQAKQSGKPININETVNNKMKKSEFKKYLREEVVNSLSSPGGINEMAAIKGDIKTKVDQIIADNPDMEVGPLARMIMKDPEINSIIDRDNLSDMAQNQTQKYIRLARGERELQQRGRKADPNKPASTPKSPKEKTGPSREDIISQLDGVELKGDDAKWAGKLDKLSTSALKSIHKNYFSDDVKNSVDVEAETGNTPTSGGTLQEMAKLTGDLADAIGNVIANVGDDLDGLALKKAIKSDPDVIAALGSDTLYDNQLNKFIALAKGERELGQRGRKADPDKQASKPKAQKPKTEKPSLVDLVDDDEVDIEDTWSKPDADFDDDFDEDKVKDVEVEENPSLDKERVQTLKDQETKKFWKNFVSQMKERGVIGNDNKPLDKEKLDKERKAAQKLLSMKLKTLK